MSGNGELPATMTVEAVIAKDASGRYIVTLSLRKNGRSRVVIESSAASVPGAKDIVGEFASWHGVPWRAVEVLYH